MKLKQLYSDMKHFYSFAFVIFTMLFLSFSTQLMAQSGNNCASAIPLTVTLNECSYTTVSNVGLTNSFVTPAGASCTGYAGGDLWLSVVLPESGEVYVNSRFIPGVSNLNMDINMAIYSGSCGSLSLIGCDDDSGDGFYPAAILTGTPGSTMYLQFWDTQNNQQSPLHVCANGTPTCNVP